MSNLSLYTVADQYLKDIEKLNNMELDEQTLIDTLESLSGDLEIKATNVAMFARNLEATAESIKAAEKAMYERRKALENRAAKIREYLKTNMERTGVTKIECAFFQLSIRKNPEAVEVINLDLIPSEFFDIPPPPAPVLNKTSLKEAMKNGLEIEGARLTRGTSLQIK